MEELFPTAMGEYIKVNRWDIYQNQTDFYQSQTKYDPTPGPTTDPTTGPTTGAGNVGLSLHDQMTSMGRPVYRNRDRFLLLYREIESRKGASVSGWTIVISGNILFASREDSSTYKPVEATRSSSNTAICPDQLGSTEWEMFPERAAASITIVQGGAH